MLVKVDQCPKHDRVELRGPTIGEGQPAPSVSLLTLLFTFHLPFLNFNSSTYSVTPDHTPILHGTYSISSPDCAQQ